MNPLLKLAYEEGKRQAEAELQQKLEAALKKRRELVGWKEQSVKPERLVKSTE